MLHNVEKLFVLELWKRQSNDIEITAEKVAPTMSVLVEIFFIFFAFNYYLLT